MFDMRNFARNNIEMLVIVSLFAIFGMLKIVVANEFAFLNLYFIPVLISGYFLGKKRAILSAVASVLLTVLFLINWPDELLASSGQLYGSLNILVWASLLVLSSILVSTINESRHHRHATATLQLLEKYMRDMAAQENHCSRVGRLTRAIAQELKLPPQMIDSVEAAGLLHDVADTEAGLELISDCSRIKDSTNNDIISEAIPILSRSHRRPGKHSMPFGARILKVADLYDTAQSADQNRELLEIVQYLESKTDESCTIVIKALLRTIHKNIA
ncbi:MAG TPA: HD domain-containing protein [Actinobacteria bacterium]|nr:HD domain-containing protein [Actinomycetota bacterium]